MILSTTDTAPVILYEQRLAHFVRAGGRARREDARQFVEHPVLRRPQALQVLLRAAGHLGQPPSPP